MSYECGLSDCIIAIMKNAIVYLLYTTESEE